MENVGAREVGSGSTARINARMADMVRIVWKNVDAKMVFVIMFLANVTVDLVGLGHCKYYHAVALALPLSLASLIWKIQSSSAPRLRVCSLLWEPRSNCGKLFIGLEQQVSF